MLRKDARTRRKCGIIFWNLSYTYGKVWLFSFLFDLKIFLWYTLGMENLNFIIAKNLTNLRKKNKLTQLELANLLNYSDKAISKWENGESMPGVEVLYRISKIYNVSLDYIVGEKTNHKELMQTPLIKKRRCIITLLSVLAVWFAATIFYVAFGMFSSIKLWILFCWAVPASFIVWLIFDAIWNRHKLLFWLVSLIIWSFLICLSLQFFNYNIWQILFIGIPLQIGAILWDRLLK